LAPAAAVETRPLSSFSAPVVTEDSFRPLLEVDRFTWPESCDTLLAQIGGAIDRWCDELSSRATQGQRVLAIGSCRAGEGASTSLLCLAKRLAERGTRVALLDADGRSPELARRLGVAAQLGWEDVLSGDQPLAEVLIASVEDRLAVVPLRGRFAEPLADNLRGGVALGVLRDHYDLVLIDCGAILPADAAAETRSVCPLLPIDGMYLVYDARSTTPDDIAEAAQRVEKAGIKVQGVIENFSPAPTSPPALSLYASPT
jgi:Mrp family chromosome partitioning ATPase